MSTDDVLKVFKRHKAAILENVSDPQRLAEQLHSKDLIPVTVARDTLTIAGISDYRKVCIVMDEVHRNLSVGNAILKLYLLCGILKKLFTGDCKTIVEEMEREIGLLH